MIQCYKLTTHRRVIKKPRRVLTHPRGRPKEVPLSSTEFTVPTARTPTNPREAIAERIEEEIKRLREKRPHLEARIKRAEHIVTAHLASRPRMQIVRARLDAAGRCRFLVRSLTSSGAVYIVYPGDWSCSCPDFHRTSVGCKHALACWVLWRVAQPSRSASTVTRQEAVGCNVCWDGIVYIGQQFVNRKTGEVRKRTLALPCKSCGGRA